MVQSLATPTSDSSWLLGYHQGTPTSVTTIAHSLATDFRQRFLSLLSYQFRSFPAKLALAMVHHKNTTTHSELDHTH